MQVHTLKDFSTRMCSCCWSAKLTEVAFHITCKQQSGIFLIKYNIYLFQIANNHYFNLQKEVLVHQASCVRVISRHGNLLLQLLSVPGHSPTYPPKRAPQRKISKETHRYSRWNKCSLKVHMNSTFYKPFNLWKTTSASVCLSGCILTPWETSNTSASLHLLLSVDTLS